MAGLENILPFICFTLSRSGAAAEEMETTENNLQYRKAGVVVFHSDAPNAGLEHQPGTKKTNRQSVTSSYTLRHIHATTSNLDLPPSFDL